MNFFGHAVVASWYSARPTFVLGAMLPDFAAMIGARPPLALEPVLAGGVRLHHETDHAFHDSATFRALSGHAHGELVARGLRRGPARAVAHIGVEILIDGVLAADGAARRAYLAALTLGRALGSDDLLWQDPASAHAFGELVAALSARGVSRSHHTPEVLTLRVARALSGRPRLCLAESELAGVTAWAESAEPEVSRLTDGVVRELSEALAASAPRC